MVIRLRPEASCLRQRLLSLASARGRSGHIKLLVLERLEVVDDDFRAGDFQNAFCPKFVQGLCHPLPGGADDERNLLVGDRSVNDDVSAFVPPVRICKDHQELAKPFGDRARSQHLDERRVALSFCDQPMDDGDGHIGDLAHELLQAHSREEDHLAVLQGISRPDVSAATEDFGSADKVARCPVGKRDFAAGWANVVSAGPTRFDDPDAGVAVTLVKDALPFLERAARTHLSDGLLVASRQSAKKTGTLVDVENVLGEVDSPLARVLVIFLARMDHGRASAAR